jgi:hypothetical protein
MQTTAAKTLTIGLLYENSDVGSQFIQSLKNTFGEGKDACDQRSYLYKQFSKVIGDVHINLNALLNTESNFIGSLHPVLDRKPDLILIFNSCVGVNTNLRPGDLVIQEKSHDSFKKMIKENEHFFTDSLPELKLGVNAIDLEATFLTILQLLHAGPKTGKEIRDSLHFSGEQMRLVIDKILMPHNEKFWKVNVETRQWELTEEGKEKYKTQSSSTLNKANRKPLICMGSSDCTPGLIKSTTNLKVDVIEQLSRLVFEQHIHTVNKIKTIQVSIVKCMVNGDIEESSPYAESMGEILAAFTLKMATLYTSRE